MGVFGGKDVVRVPCQVFEKGHRLADLAQGFVRQGDLRFYRDLYTTQQVLYPYPEALKRREEFEKPLVERVLLGLLHRLFEQRDACFQAYGEVPF